MVQNDALEGPQTQLNQGVAGFVLVTALSQRGGKHAVYRLSSGLNVLVLCVDVTVLEGGYR